MSPMKLKKMKTTTSMEFKKLKKKDLQKTSALKSTEWHGPMHSKKSQEVTRTTMEMITRLRMDGFSVNQIHADQGHEFAGHFTKWCSRRGTLLTKTAGDEPQSNGRAENTVRVVKKMVRKILHGAGEDSKRWPWAVRYCNEVLRMKRLREPPEFPPFLQEVLTRKRRWKKGELEPTMETVRYLGPSPENHGHWIVKEGETPRLTQSIFKKVEGMPNPAHWMALERELLDGLTLRRRLREKTTIKKIDVVTQEENEKEEKVVKKRGQRTVDEEMRSEKSF